MKIFRLEIGFFVVLLSILLVSGGCGKKIASLKGSSPSTSSNEVETTVEADNTAKNGTTDEVVTEPIALLNPNIAEDAIEPNDTTDGAGKSDVFGVPDKAGEPAGRNGEKEALSGELRDVFFEFDMTILKETEMENLKNNADWLKKNKSAVVRIEGHADERGTSEYNLALAEKRAQMVKKYLTVFGVPHNRVDILSYGEEKGFCSEHNEECWAKNRRGHFVVVAK